MGFSVFGGSAAIAVSGVLFLAVLQGVGLNALNGWTIVLGLVAGLVAILGRHRRGLRLLSVSCLVLAAVPALIGGVGLLYLPAVVLIGLAARREVVPT